tara:strand:+ start:776 stop:1012 length:237 start_codon:yes stop_codon:yes gene_type:complete
MTNTDKKIKIITLANDLRELIESRGDLQVAMRHLFSGEASMEDDNDFQIVVYTGHTTEHMNDGSPVISLDDQSPINLG